MGKTHLTNTPTKESGINAVLQFSNSYLVEIQKAPGSLTPKELSYVTDDADDTIA